MAAYFKELMNNLDNNKFLDIKSIPYEERKDICNYYIYKS